MLKFIWLLILRILIGINRPEWADVTPFFILAMDLSCFALVLNFIFRNPLRGHLSEPLKSFYEKAIKAQKLEWTQAFFEFVALVFLGFWLHRWTLGIHHAIVGTLAEDVYAMLDVALFCYFVSGITKSRRFLNAFVSANISSSRKILIHYFLAISTGAFLLMLPLAHKTDQHIEFIDALFISVSALSVTGLATIDVASIFNTFGLMVLMTLIQLGGLGIVIIIAGISLAKHQRVTLSDTSTVQELYGIPNLSRVPDFLLRVLGFTLLIELLGALLIYASIDRSHPQAWLHSVFHAVSAFCNAGFSSFSNNLFEAPFSGLGYASICLLIMIGGLGFPVIFEVLSLPFRNLNKRLSANTKLTLSVTLFLWISGVVLFFAFETLRHDPKVSNIRIFWESVFYSISSRTAGFNSIPVQDFDIAAQFLLILLMFVGASPISTGGGIKTTQLGILFSSAVSFIKGSPQVEAFKRQIPHLLVLKTMAVVFFYFCMAILATLFLLMTENQDPFAIIFEVISALSTVGLSTGITYDLSTAGKICIMLCMLIGRIGLLVILYASLGQIKKTKLRYPEGDFYVG